MFTLISQVSAHLLSRSNTGSYYSSYTKVHATTDAPLIAKPFLIIDETKILRSECVCIADLS